MNTQKINKDDLINLQLKDIVTQNYKTADVFEKYNIDFCWNGNRILNEVLKEVNEDSSKILDEILSVYKEENFTQYNFNNWNINGLIDHIVNVHHKYVNDAIPKIKEHLIKVEDTHGYKYQYLREVKLLFDEISYELINHMIKEEKILFPFMKYLIDCERYNEKPKLSSFGTIKNPIKQMEAEHNSAGNVMHKIRLLTNNYELPKDASATFSLTYKELKKFEQDLHKHIHLENYALFPKAIELENKLNNK